MKPLSDNMAEATRLGVTIDDPVAASATVCRAPITVAEYLDKDRPARFVRW